MLLTILLLWCSGTFCGEVSKGVKEYSFEKHREEIVKDLREDIEFGVYACYVYINNERYLGVCNIGSRPTIDNSKTVEVNIIDFFTLYKLMPVFGSWSTVAYYVYGK